MTYRFSLSYLTRQKQIPSQLFSIYSFPRFLTPSPDSPEMSPLTEPSATNSPDTPKSRSQRLFTEKDEYRLLKALLKSTKVSNSPISDRIGKSLSADFSSAQITDKVRRLRQKYHKQARTKSLIKTPHDRKIYEIARKIWGKNSLRKTNSMESVEKKEEGKPISGNLWDFPVLMGEIYRLPESVVWREGLRCLEESKLKGLNEKWMLQQIEEAEVLARKAELVHEQTKLILEAVMAS